MTPRVVNAWNAIIDLGGTVRRNVIGWLSEIQPAQSISFFAMRDGTGLLVHLARLEFGEAWK